MKKIKIVEEVTTGLRMEEGAATKLGELRKKAPKEAGYKRMALMSEEFTLDAGSRTDVSMITTDAVDRDGEVVMPGGIDVTTYNGVVTFAHEYDELPMGRCLWIKPKDNGLLAKTQYAAKPADWSGDWMPDAVLSLMQMDPPTCTGKSIGFIRLGYHEPTPDEVRARPELANCWLVTDAAALVEYAVAPVPCNPDAEMLAISKSIESEGLSDAILEAARKIAGTNEAARIEHEARKETRRIAAAGYVTPAAYANALAKQIAEQKGDLVTLVRTEIREQFLDLIGRA